MNGHVPVLLNEAIDFLAVKPGGTYIDATMGLGGHSLEIAKRLGAQGRLIGFDKDPAALEQARAAAGTKDVWVSGASTIVQYLQAGLLEQLHIHLIPVLLGSGRRLFDNLGPGHIELQLARLRQSPGATHLLFEVRK